MLRGGRAAWNLDDETIGADGNAFVQVREVDQRGRKHCVDYHVTAADAGAVDEHGNPAPFELVPLLPLGKIWCGDLVNVQWRHLLPVLQARVDAVYESASDLHVDFGHPTPQWGDDDHPDLAEIGSFNVSNAVDGFQSARWGFTFTNNPTRTLIVVHSVEREDLQHAGERLAVHVAAAEAEAAYAEQRDATVRSDVESASEAEAESADDAGHAAYASTNESTKSSPSLDLVHRCMPSGAHSVGSNDEEEEDESRHAGGQLTRNRGSDLPPSVLRTMLDTAKGQIVDYKSTSSKFTAPLHISSVFSSRDRHELHVHARNLGLYSHSDDRAGGKKQVCVRHSAPNVTISAATAMQAKGYQLRMQRPEHDGGNLKGHVRDFNPETKRWACEFNDPGSEQPVHKEVDLKQLNEMLLARYDEDAATRSAMDQDNASQRGGSVQGRPKQRKRKMAARTSANAGAPQLYEPHVRLATLMNMIDPNWDAPVSGRIDKWDARHWLALFTDLVAARLESPLAVAHMQDFARALFWLRAGEYDRVANSLYGRVQQGKMKHVSYKYFRKRCRYVIVAPGLLMPAFNQVFNFYFSLEDPERPGSKFYKTTATKDFLLRMGYLAKGKTPACTVVLLVLHDSTLRVKGAGCKGTSRCEGAGHERTSRCKGAGRKGRCKGAGRKGTSRCKGAGRKGTSRCTSRCRGAECKGTSRCKGAECEGASRYQPFVCLTLAA